MIITTTIKIHVSPENEGLVPYVLSKNGGLMGDETLHDGIKRVRDSLLRTATENQILPHIKEYFGEKEAGTANSLKEQLKESLSVETVIE